jgi:hypothetical protein
VEDEDVAVEFACQAQVKLPVLIQSRDEPEAGVRKNLFQAALVWDLLIGQG